MRLKFNSNTPKRKSASSKFKSKARLLRPYTRMERERPMACIFPGWYLVKFNNRTYSLIIQKKEGMQALVSEVTMPWSKVDIPWELVGE